jgi:L-ascorbate metabolism protein UlaG (beta-lactamase superfamily)
MQIQYFGLSSFKISTKEATIITDPFDKQSGLTPPRGQADILILGEKANPLYSATSGISGDPFLVDDPGEYDIKGVTITGLPLEQNGKFITIYLIESEDIKILNLSHIKNFNIKEEDLEALGEIDILILPVGGKDVMDASNASKATNEVEAKIVIPSHYKIPGLKVDAEDPAKFIKEAGGKNEPVEKLTVKKKDLAIEGTNVVILEPMR